MSAPTNVNLNVDVDVVVDFTPGEALDGKAIVAAAQLTGNTSDDPVMVKVNSGTVQFIVVMGEKVAVVDPVGEARRVANALCNAIKEAEGTLQVINAGSVSRAIEKTYTMFGAGGMASATIGQAMQRATAVYAQAIEALAVTAGADQVAGIAEEKAPQLGTSDAWKNTPRPN